MNSFSLHTCVCFASWLFSVLEILIETAHSPSSDLCFMSQPRTNCDHPSSVCSSPFSVLPYHSLSWDLTQYTVVVMYLSIDFICSSSWKQGTYLVCLPCYSCIPSTENSSCSINVCRMCLFPWLASASRFSSAGCP